MCSTEALYFVWLYRLHWRRSLGYKLHLSNVNTVHIRINVIVIYAYSIDIIVHL